MFQNNNIFSKFTAENTISKVRNSKYFAVETKSSQLLLNICEEIHINNYKI